MARLQLEKIIKRYGAVPTIHGVDLTIDDGEFVVFVGPSGCGKSTLLRMIAGLEPITGGTLAIDGDRMNEVAPSKRGIAMVFQSYALYPHMNVYRNLAFGLETQRMPRAEIEKRVKHAAAILQIEPLLERKPKALSGGQRQRVAIGRAIVREPKIFLFDEPLSNLDAELRVAMRVEIAKLHRQLGNTMIYVTHDQTEAMTLADKIVVLRNGQIEQVGKPLDLYNRPANRFVAGFIGSPKMNFIELAGSDPASLKVPHGITGNAASLGVRPEHIRIAGGHADELVLGSVAIEHSEQLGSETVLYGKLKDGQVVTLALGGQQRVNPGEQLSIAVDPQNVHAFDKAGSALTAVRAI